MALIETFTDDLDDFSQWTLTYDAGLPVTGTGGNLVFSVPASSAGVQIDTTASFEAEGSWTSVSVDNYDAAPDGLLSINFGIQSLAFGYTAYGRIRYLTGSNEVAIRFEGDVTYNVTVANPGVPIYLGATFADGDMNFWYSLDEGATWVDAGAFTDLATWDFPEPFTISLYLQTSTPSTTPYDVLVSNINEIEPTLPEPAPLVETVTDDFDDLSAWTQLVGGAAGGVFTGEGSGVLSFTGTAEGGPGGNATELMASNDTFTFEGSWFSFKVDDYDVPRGAGVGWTNDIWSFGDFDGAMPGTMAFSMIYQADGSFLLGQYLAETDGNFDPEGAPFIIGAKESGGTVEVGYSVDDGASWTSILTYPFTPASPASLMFYFSGSSDIDISDTWTFSELNVHEPFVAAVPELTEVDKTLDLGWHVRSTVDKTLTSTWNQATPYLRHSTRHLHKTVFDYLSDQLEVLGWTVPDQVPFGAPAVVLQDLLPEEWTGDSVLFPGTVAVTLGDEGEAKGQELGGPLALIDVPIFIDIFMDTPGTTLALALDIRDIFCGRLPGTSRYLNVTNYNNVPASAAPGYTVEIEDVTRDTQRRNWETVKLTANMYFPDSEGN